MHLVVVTPRGSKVDTDVTMVTVSGEMGELGILPGHRALITALSIGMLTYNEGGKTKHLATGEGFAEGHEDQVVVVTETAEDPDEIAIDRAKKALDESEALLKTVDPHADSVGWKQVSERRQRALNRLAVSRFATPEALRIQQERAKQAQAK